MTRSRAACLIVLSLTLVLPALRAAEEPRRDPALGRLRPQDREALAESIPRRELELALRQREEVLAEVEQRLAQMRVSASAEELTDLLMQSAHLEIALDKCSLSRSGAAGADPCRALQVDLAGAERSFRQKTGLSMNEFRNGRKETPAPASRIGRPRLSKSQACTCTFTLYSMNRWMNRWWGLECGGHASHGVCSNNVDWSWPHTPGTGAMTGDIDLYFGGGAYHQHRSCPDDHQTCFRGPSQQEFGEWGNVCSCDTVHSQYSNPYGDWYGGDLTDSPAIDQMSTPWVTVGGSCNGAYVVVKEYIQEHDPGCCDDPMGDLWFAVQVADGGGISEGQASLQNCNGGSQSGVYPYCGTFGATLRVAYICQTSGVPDPPCDNSGEPSCWDSGGTWDPGSCSCTYPCHHDGNCAEWDDVNCVCLRA
jgi:hypothetical protein